MTVGDLITAQLQVEWRGTLWGWPATGVAVTDLTGWLDLPPMRGQNAARPNRHGATLGQRRAGERVVEVELTVADDSPLTLTAIRTATAIDEDPAEEPLVAWFGTDEARLIQARLERRAVPTDHEWSVGSQRARLQWVASDPRHYSVAEHSATIGLPSGATGGLAFPLSFPLSFGSATAAGQLAITNAGDASTWASFDITGPTLGPILTNLDDGRVLKFASTFEVPVGQTLTVDTDARSATLAGVPRGDQLQQRGWFPLAPGVNHIAFTSAGAFDPAASLTVRWRDAWWG